MTKILIVEDEPGSLKILRYFLGRHGYETAGAKDGLEALELFSQSRYDLVLSDLKMPQMDGLALARRILSTIPLTPFFLMTADDSVHIKAIREFGVPCLIKPLSLEELLARIQKVIGRPLLPS
jgi:DNA-binding response OmpR family regulator